MTPTRFDAGVHSGLGARNIGSATLSGRIAAIDARSVQGKATIYVGSASGDESASAASGSGLFQSSDGGNTWQELEAASAKGPPAKPWGRAVIAAAPSQPDILYWFVESTRSALFRSSDGGQTWEERDRSQMMVWRPFYFGNLVVDPTSPERLFKAGGNLIASVDGGKSFGGSGGSGHGPGQCGAQGEGTGPHHRCPEGG